MKFSLPVSALAAAIKDASSIVERRNTIPILSNAVITAQGSDTLSIRATDLDIEITLMLEAKVEEDGSITVPAHLLHDIARKLPAGAEMQFRDDIENHMMMVTSGRSRFQMQTLPVRDYPELSAGQYTHHIEMKGADLLTVLDQVAFAVSTEETRYYLNGIYLHAKEIPGQPLKLRFVATDGHRLSRAEINAPEGAEGMPGIIIPRKTVGELKDIAKAAADEMVTLSISATKIRAEHSRTVLVSKLIDGTFPDYERVIPPAPNLKAVCDTKALAAATDRVSTVSSERGRHVKLTFKDKELHLSVRNADIGEGTDNIDCDYPGDFPLEIGFNARYLCDIIAAIGSRSVNIGLTDTGSPTVFTSDDKPGLLTVLMPMRV